MDCLFLLGASLREHRGGRKDAAAHALPENSLTATSGRSLCHAKVQKAHARARCTSRRKEEDQKEEEVEIHIKARDKILRGGKRIFLAAGDKAV